jgi:hypothetical protein
MKAPANTVAFARAEAKVAYIEEPLSLLANPTTGSMPVSMQEACQLQKVVLFQYTQSLNGENR